MATCLALGGCDLVRDVQNAPKDEVQQAIAETVRPLQETLASADSAEEHFAAGDELRSLIKQVEPPAGVRAIIVQGGNWGASSDDPSAAISVGTPVVVIPEEPRSNPSYCLGVTVDSEAGVIFTTSGKATLENSCDGIEAPPETQ